MILFQRSAAIDKYCVFLFKFNNFFEKLTVFFFLLLLRVFQLLVLVVISDVLNRILEC